MEFRTLAKRVLGEEIIVQQSQPSKGQLDLFGGPAIETSAEAAKEVAGEQSIQTIADTQPDYDLVISADKRKALLELLLDQKSVCFDTETTGVDAMTAEIVGMSFTWEKGKGYYVACPPDQRQEVVAAFRPFFENESIEKIAHNIKYDLKIIEKYGVAVKGPLFDTMIAHYLITPEGKHGMDYLSELYLNYKPIAIESLIGKKGKNQGNMADLDPEKIVDYACEDSDITWQLKQLFEPEIQKPHLKALFYEMEMPLVRVLKEMEMEGYSDGCAGIKCFFRRISRIRSKNWRRTLSLWLA